MNIKKSILLILGFIFMTLGAIGIVLPVLPTTPFMLLAAGCFSGSSKRMENWIKRYKYFGCYIDNYQKGTGVPRRFKIKAIIYLWISLIICMFFIRIIWVNTLIFIMGSLVTAHISSLKNKVE